MSSSAAPDPALDVPQLSRATPRSATGSTSASRTTRTRSPRACRSTSPTSSCPRCRAEATPSSSTAVAGTRAAKVLRGQQSDRGRAPRRDPNSRRGALPAPLPDRRDRLRRRVPGDGLPPLRPRGVAAVHPRRSSTRSPTARASPESRAAPRARSRCARGEGARRAGSTSCRCPRSSTGTATTGSSCTTSSRTASASPTRPPASRGSRARSSRATGPATPRWSDCTPALDEAPEDSRASAGWQPSSGRTAGRSCSRVAAGAARGRRLRW